MKNRKKRMSGCALLLAGALVLSNAVSPVYAMSGGLSLYESEAEHTHEEHTYEEHTHETHPHIDDIEGGKLQDNTQDSSQNESRDHTQDDSQNDSQNGSQNDLPNDSQDAPQDDSQDTPDKEFPEEDSGDKTPEADIPGTDIPDDDEPGNQTPSEGTQGEDTPDADTPITDIPSNDSSENDDTGIGAMTPDSDADKLPPIALLAEDTTPPQITITEAEPGHGSSGFYCEMPDVVVTEEESAISSITVTIGSSSQTYTYEDDRQEVSLDLDDVPKSSFMAVTISAENTKGLKAEQKFYVGHTMGGRSEYQVPPSCTEPERTLTITTCVRCLEGYSWKYTTVPGGQDALGHTYEQDETGKKVCSRCGLVEDGTIVGDSHTLGDYHITRNATCTEDGSRYRACQDEGCDYRVVERIPAQGHLWGEWNVTQNGDCSTGLPQIKERSCTRSECGEKDRSTLAVSHTWLPLTVKKAATCFAEGENGKQCSICGTWKVTGVIPKTAHSWEDDGDCTTPQKCSVCKEVDVTAQSSHHLAYASNETGHWQECQNSGCEYSTQTTELASHSFGENSFRDCTSASTCIICGWVKPGSGEHNLTLEITASGHSMKCQNAGCEYKSQEEAHAGTFSGDCTVATTCNKCGYAYIAPKAHAAYGAWLWDSEGHYQRCRYCSQLIKMAHVLGEDDGDCTTPIRCAYSTCDYVMVPGGSSHDFTGVWKGNDTGHYRQCQNPGCHVNEKAEPHTGGEATCSIRAVCSVCGLTYGDKNMSNHTGGTEIRDYREPTVTEKGYTGDTYCLGCNTKIASGKVIDMLLHDHKYGSDWAVDSLHHWNECTICGARGNYTDHEFSTWERNDYEHWRHCSICGYADRSRHIPQEDDNNCETRLLCSACNMVLTEASKHNFTDAQYWSGKTGHYQLCQNVGCSVKSAESPHKGGTASCSSQARCEICYAPYGQYDMNNHSGLEMILGYQDAALDTPGYTGDIYCLGCGQIKVYGQVIPAGERDHDYVQYYDGFYHWYACSRCGQRKEGTYAPHSYNSSGRCACGAADTYADHTHTWGSGSVITAPTCTSVGIKSYICTICGARKFEELPMANHTWNGAACSVCGAENPNSKPSHSGGLSGGGGSSGGGRGGARREAAASSTPGVWVLSERGWWFKNPDGTWPNNQWMLITWNGVPTWFYINAEGYMHTGWLDWNGNWYYLHTISDGTQGAMYTGWHVIDGKWYYFDASGALMINSVTPDGYRTDANGVWVE